MSLKAKLIVGGVVAVGFAVATVVTARKHRIDLKSAAGCVAVDMGGFLIKCLAHRTHTVHRVVVVREYGHYW